MSCVIVLFFKQKTAYEMLISGWSSDVCSSDLADYVTTALLPLADVVVDLHSGGKTPEFVPYAACHRLPQDVGLEARCAAAMQASNAPSSMIMLERKSVVEGKRVSLTVDLRGRRTIKKKTTSKQTPYKEH